MVEPAHLEEMLHDYALLSPNVPLPADQWAGVWAEFGERLTGWWVGVPGFEDVAELLPDYLRDAAPGAGHRPAAWWGFEAPEQRRMVEGDPAEVLPDERLCMGVPSRWRADPALLADPPMYESEAAFLKRHELFLPGEEARLAPDAMVPVPAFRPLPRTRNNRHATAHGYFRP